MMKIFKVLKTGTETFVKNKGMRDLAITMGLITGITSAAVLYERKSDAQYIEENPDDEWNVICKHDKSALAEIWDGIKPSVEVLAGTVGFCVLLNGIVEEIILPKKQNTAK